MAFTSLVGLLSATVSYAASVLFAMALSIQLVDVRVIRERATTAISIARSEEIGGDVRAVTMGVSAGALFVVVLRVKLW